MSSVVRPMGLTELQRQIAALPALPEAERMTAARALAGAAQHVLTDQRISAQTTAVVWGKLLRAVAPRTPLPPTPAATRDAALIALGMAEDPLAEVRALREQGEDLQQRLREAVVTAARAGAPRAPLADAAGIARQTLYTWLESPI